MDILGEIKDLENKYLVLVMVGLMVVGALLGAGLEEVFEDEEDEGGRGGGAFTDTFPIGDCTFSSTGQNRFFILTVGYELVLEGTEDGETERVVITVLNETENVSGVETRVIQEYETIDGELSEISRNYFAICTETNDVYYFGEAVDIYEDGAIVAHDGAWRADEPDSIAGIMIPGTPLLGARFYNEIASNAKDRAEVVDLDYTVETPDGTYTGCLRTRETTPVEPGAVDYKAYAPGVGMVQDGVMLLLSHG